MVERMEEGQIVKATGGFYYVDCKTELVECRARGKFRLDGTTPLVGDYVSVGKTPQGKGMLLSVHERKNFLVRPPVANIGLLLLVAAAADPAPNRFVIDKMLVTAAYQEIDAAIVVTKSSLADTGVFAEEYRRAGYRVEVVDSLSGDVSAVRPLLAGRLCVLAGNTGVGKSTLLNALEPSLALATGVTSAKLGRGRHTTRVTQLFSVGGGLVADTPGFSALDLEAACPIPKEKLELCFPEFSPFLGKCRFTGCSHTKEKGCAVLDALAQGEISASRHKSYCALYEEARARKPWEEKG